MRHDVEIPYSISKPPDLKLTLLALTVLLALALAPAGSPAPPPDLDEEAVQRCLAALRADPFLDGPFNRLVDLYRRAGRLDDMEADLSVRVGDRTWGQAGPPLIARVQLRAGRPEAARQTVLDALSVWPESPDLWEWRSRIDEGQGRPSDALEAAESALRVAGAGSRRLRLVERQASLFFKLNQPKKAAEALIGELRQSPADSILFKRVIRPLQEHLCWDEALAAVETHRNALPEGSPDTVQARLVQAEILWESGRYADSLEAVQSLMSSLPPDRAEWTQALESLLGFKSRLEFVPAINEFLRNAVRSSPDPKWRIALARFGILTGEERAARAALSPWERGPVEAWGEGGEGQAVQARAECAAEVARLWARLGEGAEAIRWLEYASELQPRRTDLLLELAGLCGHAGDVERQRAIARNVLQVAPESHDAVRARRNLYSSFLGEGVELFRTRRPQDATAPLRQAGDFAENDWEEAEAALWLALALEQAGMHGSGSAWPDPAEIPARARLRPMPGLEIAARQARRFARPPKLDPASVQEQPSHDSRLVWTFEPVNPENPVVAALALGDFAVGQLASGSLVGIELSTGLPRWTSPSPRGVPLAGRLRGAEGCVLEADGPALRARMASDGIVSWERPLKGLPLSFDAAEDVAAALTEEGWIEVFGLGNGKSLWQHPIKLFLEDHQDMTPELHVRRNQVTVASGPILSAFDAASGEFLWQWIPDVAGSWNDSFHSFHWTKHGIEAQRHSGDRWVFWNDHPLAFVEIPALKSSETRTAAGDGPSTELAEEAEGWPAGPHPWRVKVSREGSLHAYQDAGSMP
ncbi:MAG: PQQ-binding-like beta-propeller repeat protein [Planctomycetes bacterium]|nr:PQQ-binding-like beta-propeller repeat protein [Planctomycetota bacterium]